MHGESFMNRFAPPARPPSSYLPQPYGCGRGGVDAFARLPVLGARMPSVRYAGELSGAKRAADFGHDNLAWSRSGTRYGRARGIWIAAGGAMFGAALVMLLGTVLEVPGKEAGSGGTARAPVVAHAPERVPARTLDARAAAQPPRDVAATSVEQIAPAELPRSREPAAAVVQGECAVPTARVVRGRVPDARVAESNTTRTKHVRVAHEPSEVCDDDWPCGDTLRLMRIELANWEAERAPVSGTGLAPSVRAIEHTRLTDW
ncbi:hypothetical protein [Burkholderia ubonensis]|nr:hypothetical protein [Burkholderia ubonensis]